MGRAGTDVTGVPPVHCPGVHGPPTHTAFRHRQACVASSCLTWAVVFPHINFSPHSKASPRCPVSPKLLP